MYQSFFLEWSLILGLRRIISFHCLWYTNVIHSYPIAHKVLPPRCDDVGYYVTICNLLHYPLDINHNLCMCSQLVLDPGSGVFQCIKRRHHGFMTFCVADYITYICDSLDISTCQWEHIYEWMIILDAVCFFLVSFLLLLISYYKILM